jgi:polyphosphate kinase 2 (PPK2 family)
MAAYEDVFARTHTDVAPWYIVPADRKWYRNWAVERLVVETLEELDPRFPRPDLDVQALKEGLAPPN